MDVLSEVLKVVKLGGGLFYNAEVSAPWCARSVDARTVTSYISPNSQHVIIFHLLTEGRGYAHVEGDDRSLPLNAGDILIVPHGDPHIQGNGPPVTPMTPYCGSQPRLHSRAGALFVDPGALVHGDVDNYLERSAP